MNRLLVARIFNPQAARNCRAPGTHRSPAECNSAIQQIEDLRYEATTSGERALPPTGVVEVANNLARFIRPDLTEEYSVSVDGVRQDFIIEQRPAGEGQLRVELEVSGSKAAPLVQGARLVLDGSGRRIAYSRLRVVDVEGKELAARLEVTADGARRSRFDPEDRACYGNFPTATELRTVKRPEGRGRTLPAAVAHESCSLAVVVDDAAATYPVRIDPTFSDADWISLGGIPGASHFVEAAVTDASGNLYIGGRFTGVGDVFATNIAKWNGSAWSALGSGIGNGINSSVTAVALSGTDLYAGGFFTNAGGIEANRIAKWNGSTWSALGSGMNDWVSALALSGTDLYAAGSFTNAGGTEANRVAKWDGIAWSALGSGMNGTVHALAVSGTELYAGGFFTNAGEIEAMNIAKWNGSAWSALGSGLAGSGFPAVLALAVSGTNLYAGGTFTIAGGPTANRIAKWDGSAWSALGSGFGGKWIPTKVSALAVYGTGLYAGGSFTTAGGAQATT